MSYRYYVGYIPKDRLEEITKEADRLKSLIGTPKGNDEDETYSMYDVTDYMQSQAIKLYCLGNLYCVRENDILDILYENKSEDYSNDDTEFFFVKDDKFIYKLSRASQKIWIDYLQGVNKALTKLLNNEELSEEDKRYIYELTRDIHYEITYYEASKNVEDCPYNEWQFNYFTCTLYQQHKNFDYKNNVICVYGW